MYVSIYIETGLILKQLNYTVLSYIYIDTQIHKSIGCVGRPYYSHT